MDQQSRNAAPLQADAHEYDRVSWSPALPQSPGLSASRSDFPPRPSATMAWMSEYHEAVKSTFTIRRMLSVTAILAVVMAIYFGFGRMKMAAQQRATIQAVKQGRLSEDKGREYLGDETFNRLMSGSD